MNALRIRWHSFWCATWYRLHAWAGSRASLHYRAEDKALVADLNDRRRLRDL